MASVAITVQETVNDVAIAATDEGANVNIDVSTVVQDVVIQVQDVAVVLGSTSGNLVTYVAGQTISSGRVVVIDAGKAYLFQPGTMAHAGRAYGISRSSGVLDGEITVQIAGEVTDASFFTFAADTTLWVWADGEIKNSLPTGVQVIQKAGIASGARKMKIDLSFTAIKQV